jgi:hypothetical protein
MPEYAPEADQEQFAQARAFFAGIEEWLSGPVAAGLTHAELEEQVDARGRELLRRMYQDHLDLRAAREQRQEKVTGADGVARTRAETGHTRPLATVFGQVTVTRIAYRAAGAANVYPADAALSLPEEKHSHGLRRHAVVAAGFAEAERRDPGHRRTWVALADGNKQQIEAIEAEAARRNVTVHIVCDFVLEYAWKAAWSFFEPGDPDAEAWVAGQAAKILDGKAAQVADGIRRRATTHGYSGPEREGC